MRSSVVALALAVPSLGAQAPTVVDQVSGTTALLQAVSAVNERTVWVSGHRATVLRTTDGGATWLARPVGGADSTLQFRDVHALSDKVAWVLAAGPGAQSRIFHTRDGGTTWALQFTNPDSAAFYDCFTFFDRKRGVAYSDAAGGRTLMLRTDNGGATWVHLPASAVPAPLNGEGAFAASGGCVTSSGSRHGWVATGSPEGRLLRSDDAGRTWTSHATPFVKGDGAGMTAASFRDTKRGIGVGARISAMARDTAAAAVAITDDGGRTWTLRARPARPGALFGVAVVPKAGKATAVAAGLGGLWSTRNNAETWTSASANAYWSVGAAGRTAWGVGPNGRITRLAFVD